MAVALEKMPVVSGGSADVSRPNDSGLHGLADALDVGVRSAADIAVTAQANEINHVTSLMNDAVAGPDELKEIHDNAFFPLAKYAVKNRMGEALVAQNRQGIEDALAAAPDPIAARETLRAKQQELAQQAGDPAILVGIHQAISDIAGPALNKAAARRQETLNQQRRVAEATLFGSTANDPAAFAKAISGAVYDQGLADPTKVSEVHKSAAQVLINELAQDPKFALAAKDAAAEALKIPNLSPEDRAQYASVIQAARTAEDRQKDDLTYAQARQQSFNHSWNNIITALETGQNINPDDVANARATASNQMTFDSAMMTFLDKYHDRSTGLLGSTLAHDSRSQLKEELKALKDPTTRDPLYSPQFITDALQSFDMFMERLPRDLEPVDARKAVGAAMDAAVKHAEHQEERRKQWINEYTANEVLIEQSMTALSKEADPVKREAIKTQLRKLAALQDKVHPDALLSEDLKNDLAEFGVTILDYRH